MDKKQHWEEIYQNKDQNEVSWTQKAPQPSISLIERLDLNEADTIIDVGGGNGILPGSLMEKGFKDLTVLDISKTALEKLKDKLGAKSQYVNFVESDILGFNPEQKFDLWHDRAVFHFLTKPEEIDRYVQLVRDQVNQYLIIGTFSIDGPKKCSGLEINQYSAASLSKLFEPEFELIHAENAVHTTPFDTEQEFVFVVLKRTNG